MLRVSQKDNGLIFAVKVAPRASANRLAGLLDGALKVQLTAPPVDGAANQALLKFLAKALKLSKSNLRIVSGETSRLKSIWVGGGLSENELRRRLGL